MILPLDKLAQLLRRQYELGIEDERNRIYKELREAETGCAEWAIGLIASTAKKKKEEEEKHD